MSSKFDSTLGRKQLDSALGGHEQLGHALSATNLPGDDQHIAGMTLLEQPMAPATMCAMQTTELDRKFMEQACPQGGELLRVYACFASHDEEPPEWCMGQLFIGTEGFLFFSSGLPSWCIGPAKWVDVDFVGQVDGRTSREPCYGLTHLLSGMTHLLSGIADVEQVEEIWRQSRERRGVTANSIESTLNPQVTEVTPNMDVDTDTTAPKTADVPGAIKKAINVPDATAVTLLTRLGGHDEKFVVLQQACSHDIPYGERLWLQESFVFWPHLDGGVNFQKSVKSIWVTPLPWALSMCGVATYIEKRARADSELSGRYVAERLQNAA